MGQVLYLPQIIYLHYPYSNPTKEVYYYPHFVDNEKLTNFSKFT